jgi:transposase InsO family protein
VIRSILLIQIFLNASLVTDASDVGKKEIPPTHKEALAAVWCCEKLRMYLIGREFDLIGDNHPLVSALNPASKSRRLSFWAWKLQDFCFVFKHKHNTSPDIQVADCFSRVHETHSDVVMGVEGEINYLPEITRESQIQDEECSKLPDRLKSLDTNSRILVKGRLFVPKCLRSMILTFLHSTYAHIGTTKLYALLLKHFYWNNMKKDVASFVRQCLSCQCAKAPKCKYGMLRPFQDGEPWGTVHLDVVGPFRLQNTEIYLITAVDSFSGWAEVLEILHCPTSADFLYFLISEIIARHGVPRKVVSDNGSIMVSEVTRLFYEETGIKLSTTSSYHPQTNGKVERFHRFLKESLRASQTLSRDEFRNKLPWVLFAYRTTYHEGIKEIPFFVSHGFDARMPSSLQQESDSHDLYYSENPKSLKPQARHHALRTRKHLQDIREYVQDQRELSMAKMKKIYDGPRTDLRFKEGDYVLVWDHRKRSKMKVSKSLLLRWRGPFRVQKVLSPTNYQLEYVLDNKVVMDSHVIHMRPFDGTSFLDRKRDERLGVSESDKLQETLKKIRKVQFSQDPEIIPSSRSQTVVAPSRPNVRRSLRLQQKLNPG